jgi:hypothetical protein
MPTISVAAECRLGYPTGSCLGLALFEPGSERSDEQAAGDVLGAE